MSLTLYAGADCILKKKIELTAALCKLKLVSKGVEEFPKSALHFRRFPAVSTPQGFLGGSQTVVRYIANRFGADADLYGVSLSERAHVDSMLEALGAEVEALMICIKKGNDVGKNQQALLAAFKILDGILASRSFLVSERMTIVDITAAACGWVAQSQKYCDVSKLRNFVRMVNTVMGRCGAVSCSLKYVGCGEEKAKAAAVDVAGGGSDDEKKAVVKTVDPLDLLPPSSFDFDAWKRMYSNSKNLRGEAVPYFWDKFDPEGYQFWLVKYQRYNDKDNVELFKASNALGMFLQRVENSLRRHVFAICNVFQEVGHFDVECLFLIRGKEMPEKLREHVQFDSFTWTPIDYKANKQLIEDYFCEDDHIGQRKIMDCKTFK